MSAVGRPTGGSEIAVSDAPRQYDATTTVLDDDANDDAGEYAGKYV
jgi:hypothetical protein